MRLCEDETPSKLFSGSRGIILFVINRYGDEATCHKLLLQFSWPGNVDDDLCRRLGRLSRNTNPMTVVTVSCTNI